MRADKILLFKYLTNTKVKYKLKLADIEEVFNQRIKLHFKLSDS